MEYKLNQIYFYLTQGCNLRCRHCWIAPKYQPQDKKYPSLDTELYRDIIRQAKPLGLHTVKLTGGEPLLHPDIYELLDFIRKEELRPVIETNGVLCTAELAREIKKCKNPFVSVSIDGADRETHEHIRGVEGCFEEALQGLKNLVEAGFQPQVIMSIMKHNKDRMGEVVRLAESLGAGSVKFNIVQPTARGEKMHEAGDTISVEELVETGWRVETDLSKSTSLRLIYSHPHAFQPLSKIFGRGKGGNGRCGIFGIIGVLSDGSYALCGIGESVPELVFGHAERDYLKDIWENTEVLKDIREGLPARLEGICGNCLMKGACLGSCIAQNYYMNKNLFAPFWYCEEARKRGLFPETRLDIKP